MDRDTMAGPHRAAPPGRGLSGRARCAPWSRAPASRSWLAIVLVAFALSMAMTASTDARAQHVYRWVDERGTVHYGEKPPSGGRSVTRLDIEMRRGYPPPVERKDECQSIRCEYERLRADRLVRQEEMRKDFEARMRAGASQDAAARAQAQAQPQYPPLWIGGGVPVHRPWPRPPAALPPSPPPPQAEQGVRLLLPEGR